MNSRVHPLVVVFDLDDTLYPEHDYVRSGFAAVDQWLAARGISGFGTEALALFEAGARGNIFDSVLERLGLAAHDVTVASLVEVYRLHEPQLRFFPDAERALERCESLGLRRALVSDGWLEVQKRKVTALGLWSRINPVVLSDQFGRENWKPSRRPFDAVIEAIGDPDARFVYIADNPSKDFVAPRLLGWNTVQIVRPGGEYLNKAPHPDGVPELVLSSLDDWQPS